jgi:hypothetical protein
MIASLSVVAVLIGVGPALGASPEKIAVKRVKDAVKTRIASFAAEIAAARAVLVARIDAFEVGVRAGQFATLEAQELVDDLALHQTTVQEALFDVAVGIAADGKVALTALAGGVPLATIPLALANLPGGVPDQARASIAKRLDKSYRTIAKRLAKTSALVAKDGAATFFAALSAPPQLWFAFTDLQGDAILFDFAIDLRASAGETPGEGRLWVGGTSTIGDLDLVVSAVAMDGLATSADVPVKTGGRGRFLARLGDDGPLQRTNYLIGVIPVSGFPPGASASSAFALR